MVVFATDKKIVYYTKHLNMHYIKFCEPCVDNYTKACALKHMGDNKCVVFISYWICFCITSEHTDSSPLISAPLSISTWAALYAESPNRQALVRGVRQSPCVNTIDKEFVTIAESNDDR